MTETTGMLCMLLFTDIIINLKPLCKHTKQSSNRITEKQQLFTLIQHTQDMT